ESVLRRPTNSVRLGPGGGIDRDLCYWWWQPIHLAVSGCAHGTGAQDSCAPLSSVPCPLFCRAKIATGRLNRGPLGGGSVATDSAHPAADSGGGTVADGHLCAIGKSTAVLEGRLAGGRARLVGGAAAAIVSASNGVDLLDFQAAHKSSLMCAGTAYAAAGGNLSTEQVRSIPEIPIFLSGFSEFRYTSPVTPPPLPAAGGAGLDRHDGATSRAIPREPCG